MNLELNYPQTYTETASEPQFQTWAPIPAVTNYYYNTNVGSLPIIIPTNYKIKDFRGTPAEVGYTSIRCVITHLAGTFTAVNWLSISSIPNPGNSVTISPLSNSTTVTYTNTLQNVNLLSPGVYSRSIRFQVQGLLPNGVWQNIEAHIHEIKLTVSSETYVWNPTSFNFVHLAGTLPMEEKELTISGSAWTLILDSRFDVTTDETSGVTIANVPVINNTKVDGIGSKTIKIALKETFNNETPPAVGNGSWRLSQSGTFIADIPFSIVLLDISNVIDVNPSVLNFTAIKSVLEPQPLFLEVNATIEFALSHSPWLIVTEGINDVNGVIKQGYWVVPIPTQNMEPANYVGYVLFDFEYESEALQINVVVNYELAGFIASPYTENAFTLDSKFYDLNGENELVYYEVLQQIKTFDFFTDNEKYTDIEEKFPLYKRKSKFNVGERVHRLMDKFKEPNENYWQYRPAELEIIVTEKLLLDNSVIRTATLTVQKFVAGISDNVTQPYTFLDVNSNKQRATKMGYTILNMLLPSIPLMLKTYRNGVLVQEEKLPLSNGKIVSKHKPFGSFAQGDIIKYTISQEGALEELVEKTFGIIPEGRYSNMIVWENEFLLQSVLECIGSFSSETELGITSMEKFQNLVEVLEYLEVRKKSKFSINTGWLLKNDHITIESLMASKRVWIQLPNSAWISVRPLSKKMVNIDSERGLIDYDLEFQLNRTNNAKTYSF